VWKQASTRVVPGIVDDLAKAKQTDCQSIDISNRRYAISQELKTQHLAQKSRSHPPDRLLYMHASTLYPRASPGTILPITRSHSICTAGAHASAALSGNHVILHDQRNRGFEIGQKYIGRSSRGSAVRMVRFARMVGTRESLL
jgi:hypothetical protein